MTQPLHAIWRKLRQEPDQLTDEEKLEVIWQEYMNLLEEDKKALNEHLDNLGKPPEPYYKCQIKHPQEAGVI